MTGKFTVRREGYMWVVNYVSHGRSSYIVSTTEHEDALRVVNRIRRFWGKKRTYVEE